MARYTPTCVGKTGLCLISFTLTPVHPHVCGENAYRINALVYQVGTPPRVWGKLFIAKIIIIKIKLS